MILAKSWICDGKKNLSLGSVMMFFIRSGVACSVFDTRTHGTPGNISSMPFGVVYVFNGIGIEVGMA